MKRLILVTTSVLLLCGPAVQGQQKAYPHRWFYRSTNLQVGKNADETIRLAETAAKHGLNGMVLADWKHNRLGDVPREYFANVARVRAACKRLGIDVIPTLFPIGYSSGILLHDPNLAEGLPVTSAPFVVEGGVARLAGDGTSLPNGDFEQLPARAGKPFPGVRWMDAPGVSAVADRQVVKLGRTSLRMGDFRKGRPDHGNCRVVWNVKLTPHRCYRIGGWVKTDRVSPVRSVRIQVLAPRGVGQSGHHSLGHEDPPVKATGDWKRFDILFNSLDHSEANVYVGIWGGRAGRIWWDGLVLEECGIVNALRREGTPLTVTSADGASVYEEGKDFEAIPGPKNGSYRWHAPLPIRLTRTSRIKEGQKLAVSWYHPAKIHWGQVACCMSAPKVYRILDDQCRRVVKLFEHPNWLFMSHDEIRTAGTDLACTKRKMTCGEILADNVRKCTAICRRHNPTGRICVWSDMLDPTHNAKDHYYLCGSTFAGSWKGLDKDVVIVNWFGRPGSLEHFQKLGHKQIAAAYYDQDLDQVRGWLKKLKPIDGTIGIMYTTWQHKYADLAAFGDLVSGK